MFNIRTFYSEHTIYTIKLNKKNCEKIVGHGYTRLHAGIITSRVPNRYKMSLVKLLSRVGAQQTRIFSRNIRTTSIMPAKDGDKVPSVDLYEMTPTNKVNLNDIASNKKVIVFGVPGAFTPGCTNTHLPGFIERAEELKGQGFSEIFCIAVNDPFVMDSWGKTAHADGKVRMLADPAAEFTKAMDLAETIPALGGVRCKRFSMIVDHGIIRNIQVEPDGTGLSCSLAQNLKLKI